MLRKDEIVILVVGKPGSSRSALCKALQQEGYQTKSLATGTKALDYIFDKPPQLILLDWTLQDMSGADFYKQLNEDRNIALLPLIIHTSRSKEEDIIAGLRAGADDFIAGPISDALLAARVHALLRRSLYDMVNEQIPLRFGALEIHPGRREVTVNGKVIRLTASEYSILYLLARRPGWIFTRERIVNVVRGSHYTVTERAVDVQIFGLRKKLGKVSACVQTVHGVGYRFSDLAEDAK